MTAYLELVLKRSFNPGYQVYHCWGQALYFTMAWTLLPTRWVLIVSCGRGRFSFYQYSLFSYGIPDHAVLFIEFWRNVAENEGCAKRMMATLALLLDTSRWVGVRLALFHLPFIANVGMSRVPVCCSVFCVSLCFFFF